MMKFKEKKELKLWLSFFRAERTLGMSAVGAALNADDMLQEVRNRLPEAWSDAPRVDLTNATAAFKQRIPKQMGETNEL